MGMDGISGNPAASQLLKTGIGVQEQNKAAGASGAVKPGEETDSRKETALLHRAKYDRFELEEEEDTPGTYKISKDENSNLIIEYQPHGQQGATAGSAPAQAPGNEADPKAEEPSVMKCTVDTSDVDAELKQLQVKTQRLQQQIQQASGDSNRVEELERQLTEADAELRAKSSDSYRKQNSSFTYGE